MNKSISITLFILFFMQISFAQNVVYFPKDYTTEQIEQIIKSNKIENPIFLMQEKAVISDKLNPYLESLFYTASVKIINNHIAFPKNEIIVRIEKSQESEFLNYLKNKDLIHFTAHKFIPNQYLIKAIGANEQEVFRLQTELKNQSFIKLANINYFFNLNVNSTNDPLLSLQWSIKNNGTTMQGPSTVDADMSVIEAWSISTGNSDIKIAIFDSGVDTLHEDLVDNLLAGFDAFGDSSQNTNGYPTPNFSSDGHGTACAGIAAAAGNNNKGIAGIAYDCKIIPVRIFYYQNFGPGLGVQPVTTTDALLNGTAYGWRVANADIMSTSAGLGSLEISFLGIQTAIIDFELEEAYKDGRNGFGAAMFFSAGNDNVDDVLWPANLDFTIAVGASSMCDERKSPSDCSNENWGSSYGDNLDFVAPGVSVTTTDMTGSNGYSQTDYYNSFNGTSAACPNAAGVGALLLGVNKFLNAEDIREIISLTADKVDNYDFDSSFVYGSWNYELGYGRVNAYEAVKLAQSFTPSNTNDKFVNLSFNIYPNPSSNIINITTNTSSQKNIIIRNMEGKVVFNNAFHDNHKIIQIDILPKGFYLIECITENERAIKKLIIN